MLSKASVRYQLFVFRSILLQTSSSQVGSPSEIYPQVHKEIINLNCIIPRGILFPFQPCYVRLAEPYHVVPLESKWPVAWNLSQYSFIFEHNTDANMLCRLFHNRKYMDIYLPIHQEYCYLGKQKINLYFSASTCEYL